jgi:hypothetical protein
MIPEDAIIADIIEDLRDPLDYVRRVLGNMHEFRQEHGSAAVRIGTTGRGIVPHYRIEPPDRPFLEDMDLYYVAFDGRSHKRLPWGTQLESS